MRKVLHTMVSITVSAFRELAYCIKFNARYVIGLLNLLLPYAMYILGCKCGNVSSWYLVIPSVAMLVLYYMREIANRSNVGSSIPVPHNRFTQVDEDGETTVETRRIQELILYMADLEDWLTRKGLL